MEAPESALGKRVRCPDCGAAFPASLPKAILMEEPPPPQLEPPPPGFAEYPGRAAPPPAGLTQAAARQAARPGDLIATPVDEDDHKDLEPTDVVPPSPAPATPAGPMEIVEILQQRYEEEDIEDVMADAMAALGSRRGDDDEQDDTDALQTDAVSSEEDVDDALADLVPAADGAVRAEMTPQRPRNKANQWYIVSDKVEYGPYSGQAVLAAVRAGRLGPQVLLHDGLAEVELTVGQLIEAIKRQGVLTPRPGQGGHVGPLEPEQPPAPELAAPPPATTSARPGGPEEGGTGETPVPQSARAPAAPEPANDKVFFPPPAQTSDAIDALARMLGGGGDNNAALPPAPAPAPPRLPAAPRPRPRGIGVADAALAMTAVALVPVAVSLLLPWLAPHVALPLERVPNRLPDLAKPWAFALAGVTFGGLVFAVGLLGGRRWYGRRLMAVCLLLICLAGLVIQGMALHDIKDTYGILIRAASLGVGAWFSIAGASVAIVSSAIAAAGMTIVRRKKGER